MTSDDHAALGHIRLHIHGTDYYLERLWIPADVDWTCECAPCSDAFERDWIVLREVDTDRWFCSQSCAQIGIELITYTTH